jgi:hypothetical protein
MGNGQLESLFAEAKIDVDPTVPGNSDADRERHGGVTIPEALLLGDELLGLG